jgi:hypothetical protein
MTEAEWLACADPRVMLKFLCEKENDRKLRLFAVACSRHVIHWMADERSRNALDISEQYADRLVGRKTLSAARREAFAASKAAESPQSTVYSWSAASHAAVVALNACADHQRTESRESLLATAGCAVSLIGHESLEAGRAEEMFQCLLLRDIFGNPFRPITISPDWPTATVIALARGMYKSRDFSPMPILADAMEDAGCENSDVLTHCRGPGTHVRGCWVVDTVLGRE